jgi:hypothetical protein
MQGKKRVCVDQAFAQMRPWHNGRIIRLDREHDRVAHLTEYVDRALLNLVALIWGLGPSSYKLTAEVRPFLKGDSTVQEGMGDNLCIIAVFRRRKVMETAFWHIDPSEY